MISSLDLLAMLFLAQPRRLFVGFLCHKGALLSRDQLVVPQDPKIFFRAALHPVSLQHVLVPEVIPP